MVSIHLGRVFCRPDDPDDMAAGHPHGDQMIGQVGDNIYFVWMIGWFKKALFDLHVNPFNVWFLNYPEGWSLAYTEITRRNCCWQCHSAWSPAQHLPITQPICCLSFSAD